VDVAHSGEAVIPVGRLAPPDQWDQHLLDLLFANQLHPTGLEFKRVEGYPNTDGCVLLIPGRYWHEHTDQVNEAVQRYKWLLAMRVGDEQDEFNIHDIDHPNCRWWVQTPQLRSDAAPRARYPAKRPDVDRDYEGVRLFGCGYPPHFDDLPAEPPDKDMTVFLSAQNNHPRRKECFQALEQAHVGLKYIHETTGFTEGLLPEAYTAIMARTKIAPCPAGPHTPDTFRLYEALEAHCVPIADDITPDYNSEGYWQALMPDATFPILHLYRNLPDWINDQLRLWPANVNRITAHWMRYKRQMALWLTEDLKALGAL